MARRDEPVEIYGDLEKVYARRTTGAFRGKRFVHTFTKRGTRVIGLPKGAVLEVGDRRIRLGSRAVLLVGPRDLWRLFSYEV